MIYLSYLNYGEGFYEPKRQIGQLVDGLIANPTVVILPYCLFIKIQVDRNSRNPFPTYVLFVRKQIKLKS